MNKWLNGKDSILGGALHPHSQWAFMAFQAGQLYYRFMAEKALIVRGVQLRIGKIADRSLLIKYNIAASFSVLSCTFRSQTQTEPNYSLFGDVKGLLPL